MGAFRATQSTAAVILAMGLVVPASISAATSERLSVSSLGTEGDAASADAAISADGRYVAFSSPATTIVAGDGNGVSDVFVRDRLTGSVIRASTNAAGIEATGGDSLSPAISADGRFVAFHSTATNLVIDGNGVQDVFVKDLLLGSIERVSVDTGLVEANGSSSNPAMSSDGRYVAFESTATNLVVGDTNGVTDVFVRDRAGTTSRVSLATFAGQSNAASSNPAMSGDGRFVAFDSSATSLVPMDTSIRDVFVRDRDSGTTENISRDGATVFNGASQRASFSADGRYVAYESQASNAVPGDANGASDVFVRDRSLGTTARASVGVAAQEGNGGSSRASISADGRYVAFESGATNLVDGDANALTDVFARDRVGATTERVSTPTPPAEGDNSSGAASISADGRFVAFDSLATNLVPGDFNTFRDVFLAAVTPPAVPTPQPPATPTPPPAPPPAPPAVQAVRRLAFGPITVVRLPTGVRELRLRVRNSGTMTERFTAAGARLTLRRGARAVALLRPAILAVAAGKTGFLRFRYAGRERGALTAVTTVRAAAPKVTGPQIPATPPARTLRQGVRL